MNKLSLSLTNWMNRHRGTFLSDDTTCPEPFAYYARRISDALNMLGSKKCFDVLFFSHRPEYFDVSDMVNMSSGVIQSVTFCSTETELWKLDKKYDIAIACTHLVNDHLSQLIMRSRNLATIIVAWTWDNHHLPFENLCNTSLADLVLPAHDFCSDRLKAPHYIVGESFPLCTGQWSRKLSETLLTSTINKPRSNSLYGGYIMWEGSSRNEQLQTLKREIPENQLDLIDENKRGRYFGLGAEERFRDWCSYKVSVQIPYAGDLSLRIFDALLAGQIPIVPENCFDLDRVVPRSLQDCLPILRVKDVSTAAVNEALREGISRFDDMGANGIRQRHEFARDHHHITSRVQQIATYVSELRSNMDVELCINNAGVGLVQR